MLHERVLDLFLPLVASDCTFTRDEWYGDRWDPHITLASHDLDGVLVQRITADLPSLIVGGDPLHFPSVALVRASCTDWHHWWRDVVIETHHELIL